MRHPRLRHHTWHVFRHPNFPPKSSLTDDLGRPGLNAHHIADEVLATQHQNSNSPAGPTYESRVFPNLELSLQWNPIESHFKLQTCLTGFHMCLWHSPLPTADPGKKDLTWHIYVYLDSIPFIICTSQHITTNSPLPVQTARPPAEKKHASRVHPAIFGATKMVWEVNNAEFNFMQPSSTRWPRFNS